MTSIDELSSEKNSDEESISTDDLGNIRYGSYVHMNINARDYRLKIRYRIGKYQSEWKGA